MMGVHIRAVLPALICCLCLLAAGCAKPRAQTAPPLPPPEPLPLRDRITGETCGVPTKPPVPGITLPKAIYSPEPEYTDAARKAKVTGTVNMVIDVGSDGLVKNVCLARSFRKDLDEQSMRMVRRWRFEPAKKDGVPIPYSTTADVSFNLY